MPQLDSLLSLVTQQGANELRLGTDKAPAMFANGAPKKLTIPATSTETLRELFGDLLDETKLAQLDRLGRLELAHQTKSGPFQITLTKRPGPVPAFDAIVLQGSPTPSPTMTPAPAPPHKPPTAAVAPAQHAAHPRVQTGQSPYRLEGGLAALVERAMQMGASDLHLADGEPPVARVHGELVPMGGEPADSVRELAVATFGDVVEARLGERRSLDASLDLGAGARGRINVYASSRGVALAVRILPRKIPSLRELGFPLPIDELAMLPHGLVLAVGATGSGKSTTLASLAAEALARRSIVLVSLEDPIEYELEPTARSLVRQRQIGRDVVDFNAGLRDALREDPDVILIGEMRDAESIHLALTAAETGHLVLASLHSRSAASAVERIIDTYPPEKQAHIRIMLADSLRAVVAQRLVPGPSGRVLAAEILRVTTAVASAIREGKLGAIKSAMQAGRAEGMLVLERALADLVARGAISAEAARKVANDPTGLAHYLGERH
jgi:twitching motility protein PilT